MSNPPTTNGHQEPVVWASGTMTTPMTRAIPCAQAKARLVDASECFIPAVSLVPARDA